MCYLSSEKKSLNADSIVNEPNPWSIFRATCVQANYAEQTLWRLELVNSSHVVS